MMTTTAAMIKAMNRANRGTEGASTTSSPPARLGLGDGREFKGGKTIAGSSTTKAKAMTTTAKRRGDWMAATAA